MKCVSKAKPRSQLRKISVLARQARFSNSKRTNCATKPNQFSIKQKKQTFRVALHQCKAQSLQQQLKIAQLKQRSKSHGFACAQQTNLAANIYFIKIFQLNHFASKYKRNKTEEANGVSSRELCEFAFRDQLKAAPKSKHPKQTGK